MTRTSKDGSILDLDNPDTDVYDTMLRLAELVEEGADMLEREFGAGRTAEQVVADLASMGDEPGQPWTWILKARAALKELRG